MPDFLKVPAWAQLVAVVAAALTCGAMLVYLRTYGQVPGGEPRGLQSLFAIIAAAWALPVGAVYGSVRGKKRPTDWP